MIRIHYKSQIHFSHVDEQLSRTVNQSSATGDQPCQSPKEEAIIFLDS